MPIYEYACNCCGSQFEALVRAGEQPECPKCGQTSLSRQLSVPAAHVGGGALSVRDLPPPCGRGGCGRPECGL